ncbi:MAG: aminodeoxychorismate/anthranilate synthase component II, partial [Planctomycetota bacterium]
MILLIDNYDSFVHNLARYLRLLGEETVVVRNDAVDAAGVRRMAPEAVVLSPGPCSPAEAGCCVEVVRTLHAELPLLGICLGHQAIGAAFGARVVRAGRPVHGKASPIRHAGRGVFAGLPNPLGVGRYHSLVLEPGSLPPVLLPTATTDDGQIMAVRHATLPVV